MTFTEVLSRNRVPWRRGDGGEISLNCLWCDDSALALHVNVRNGKGHCWHASCGYRSRRAVADVLSKLGAPQDVEDGAPEEKKVEPVRLPSDFQALADATNDLDRQALDYLLRRGVSKRQIRERGIGVSFVGTYAWRVVVPVCVGTSLKMLVARDFTGRQKPKYLNSKGDKWLYGFDPTAKSVTLVEGVFKSLRVELSGRSSAALLGHDLTDAQLEQIRKSACVAINLLPDPDRAGRIGAVGVADKLAECWKGEVRVMWPVTVPADEMRLPELRGIQSHPYDWGMRQKLLLNAT